MTIPFRPLGIIKDMIETIGLEITYVYEDLVFIEHNAFLLQMGKEGQDVAVLFNTETNPQARPEILSRLQRAGSDLALNIFEEGMFKIEQNEEDENFQLEFIN